MHEPHTLGKTAFISQFVAFSESSQSTRALSVPFGGLATVFGGYLAAHLVKKSLLLNGFLAGVTSLLWAGVEHIFASHDARY